MNKNHILSLFFVLFMALSLSAQSDIFLNQETENDYSINEETDSPILSKTISGYVYLEGLPGNKFQGLMIQFLGDGLDVIVEVNFYGKYSKSVPDGWSGSVTPIICEDSDVTFDPPFYEFTNVNATLKNNNFDAETDTLYIISGTITDSLTGEPLANTEIRFDVETEDGRRPTFLEVTTNELGEYTIVQFPCWSAEINPGLDLHYITPFTKEYTDWKVNYTNQNYKSLNYEYDVPPEWNFTTSDKVHNMAIEMEAYPNLCGIDIGIGDLIGVFYYDSITNELACGGYARWQDEANTGLVAYGDDSYSAGKDGFVANEVFRWKVFLYSRNGEEYVPKPEYNSSYSSNNKFSSGGLSIVTSLDYYYPNQMVIPKGWSGLSSFTETLEFPPIIYKVLSPVLSDLVLIQDMEKLYYPAAGINNMFVWTNGKGYKIKMEEEAILPMEACPVSNPTVTLKSTWNLLPVLSSCNVLASELFSPILDKVIVVKEIAGSRVFWPAMGIQTLQVLEPGKAYYMAVTQNTSVTYQDCNGAKDEIVSQDIEFQNLTPWNTPVKTGFNHSIAIQADALTAFSNGDFIAAFTQDGFCAGMLQINDVEQNQVITLFGNDNSTFETDGLNDGEEIIFKAFKTASDEIMDIYVEFDWNYASSDGRFYDNGISVVYELKFSSTGIQARNSEVSFFPNPTNGLVNIRVENSGYYDMTIQTMNGQVIVQKQISGNIQLDLSDYSKGIYVVVLEDGKSKTYQKLILK